ncbi:MAG: HXXEE domain-containing protein [Dysgonamonadaceae bacterium]|jgi:hypothetical protein|nr:HXXEE domain-containing protein [Dysgonamonadaceae bacterium]
MDNLPFWILTVAYTGHIFEEYVLDWRKWAQNTSKLKFEWTEFFIANFAVIILGISASVTGFDCPVFSFMFVGLAAINGLFAHIGTTIVKRKFSPGLITSILLFVPVCTWAYIVAFEKGILTLPFTLITLGGALFIMLFPVSLQFIKQKTNLIDKN